MKKTFKILLKVFLSLLGLVLVIGVIAAIYINRTFINIDKKDKYAGVEIKEITIDGYTFRDLNRNGKLDLYEDPRQPLEKRVDDLLSQMTPEEKLRMLKGSGLKSSFASGSEGGNVPGTAGTIVPIPRLGIPAIILSDGPAGLRINPTRKNDSATYYCTAFPIGTLLASTWDTGLVEKVGEAMGNEMKEYGVDVILGPGANIQRNPLCGRNFEYYSEDPVVTGNIGAAIVNGVQTNGVGTSVKHFVANNQETNRNYNNVIVSQRALREIYLKGFEIIVKNARPWTVMSSYNKVNGTYTSESHELLTDILRNDWGYKGVVMSDWFGGENAPAQIRAGNDLLEPGTRRQYNALEKAVKKEELSEADIDTSVRRILRLVLNSRKMEHQPPYRNDPDLKAHALVTRQSASEGMVLLKNDSTLPLSGIGNIALFGETSYNFIAGGKGSGYVNTAYTVSLEEGLANAGFTINADAREGFLAFKEAHKKDFEKKGGMAAMMSVKRPPEMLPSDKLIHESEASSDMAVITIGRLSGEGQDRDKSDFVLSDVERGMIKNVCAGYHKAGKKVVVVLNIGGVIETASWKAEPDAILLAWQGGQEGGNSVADILTGRVNPSGKLTMTFPVKLEDCASSANFPLDSKPFSIRNMFFGDHEKPAKDQVRNVDYTEYKEGIYVGYRHFDKDNIEVSYPFGYGLSFTDFIYESMEAGVDNDSINIIVKIKNSGQVAGQEVVEIYISKPDSKIDRPVRELKAFAKTPLLQGGETSEVTLSFPVSDLSYWNEAQSAWSLEKGSYTINAASSSRDIRLSRDISL